MQFIHIFMYRLISQEAFFKLFDDNGVEIHPKAKRYIEQRYIAKNDNTLPFKDVLSRLT